MCIRDRANTVEQDKDNDPKNAWVSFMVDSGASETVAPHSCPKLASYTAEPTSVSGIKYSSASDTGEAITNMGMKRLRVRDQWGNVFDITAQSCNNLCKSKYLLSVSRLIQAGHRVVFDAPDTGSYIENRESGQRIWLRQDGGVYYLDLQILPPQTPQMSTFHRPGH